MQHVFGGDCLFADAALSKGQVFGNARVQVVADHQHVHVLIERVHGVRHGRVGGAGQKVFLPHHFQNVGCMAATGAFGMKSAQGAPLGCGNGVFHKARFIERVGVDRHLGVGGVGHVQAVADGRRRGAPVFVQFEANHPGVDLLVQRRRQAGVALAHKSQVHGKGVCRLQHALNVPGAGRAGGGKGAGGRTRAAAHHGGHAAGQGFFDLLRANKVNVAVNSPGGNDVALAANHLGARANDDVHATLRVWVARFANGHDAPALEANVGFDDAPVVQNKCVGHHTVHGSLMAGALALCHAVADGLAAAELHFLSVAPCCQRVVFFHFNEQTGIG